MMQRQFPSERSSLLLTVATVALMVCATRAHADVKLPAIFSGHMVLQADRPVPIWGTADAHEKVTVSIADQTKTTEANQDGKWLVTLDALSSDKPMTITVRGRNTITINDVLAGEVWLCSGQSNMTLPVVKAKDFDREQPAANWPRIRTFQGNKWVVCSPESVGGFSATAYFFGREIHQKTGLAVGLIHRSAGGTPIEFWTSWNAQKDIVELKPIFDPSGKSPASKDAGAQAEADRKQAAEIEGKQAAAGLTKLPGCLFDDKIAPLIPYAIRGVIWYQGEANSYTIHADLYGRQLIAMIKDWRARWGYDFPFLSVQLPELGKVQTVPIESSGRAFVREGVLRSLNLPQTGMAVTLGTGEVTSNHPKNKQEVGRRLALWALATVYEQKGVVASGPLPSGHKITDDKVVITFTHTGGGLVARGGELKGFAIAGNDKKWVWANAKIDGDTVIVSHPDVKEPVGVRYAWASNPDGCNLNNNAGLPASPFRTDDFPLPKARQGDAQE